MMLPEDCEIKCSKAVEERECVEKVGIVNVLATEKGTRTWIYVYSALSRKQSAAQKPVSLQQNSNDHRLIEYQSTSPTSCR